MGKGRGVEAGCPSEPVFTCAARRAPRLQPGSVQLRCRRLPAGRQAEVLPSPISPFACAILTAASLHSLGRRQTTEELIAKCKAMVDAEEAAAFEEGYINEADPSGALCFVFGCLEVRVACGGWRCPI